MSSTATKREFVIDLVKKSFEDSSFAQWFLAYFNLEQQIETDQEFEQITEQDFIDLFARFSQIHEYSSGLRHDVRNIVTVIKNELYILDSRAGFEYDTRELQLLVDNIKIVPPRDLELEIESFPAYLYSQILVLMNSLTEFADQHLLKLVEESRKVLDFLDGIDINSSPELKQLFDEKKIDQEELDRRKRRLFQSMNLIRGYIPLIEYYAANFNILKGFVEQDETLTTYNILIALDEILETCRPYAEVSNLELTFENNLPVGFEPKVLMGKVFFRLIFNILDNAIKFTQNYYRGEDGGEIQVSIGKQEKGVVITVSDNGPGVKKDMLEEIFKDKVTGNNGGTAHGTGKGLAMVKMWTEKMGGSIFVQSGEDQGFSISIVLPLERFSFNRKTGTYEQVKV